LKLFFWLFLDVLEADGKTKFFRRGKEFWRNSEWINVDFDERNRIFRLEVECIREVKEEFRLLVRIEDRGFGKEIRNNRDIKIRNR
jgi:hypothetical protein